jgi:hypothetical protein
MPDLSPKIGHAHPGGRWQPAEESPDRLRQCPTHGQQPPNAWGCPECLRELREGRVADLPRPIEVRRWIENSRHREEGGNPPEFDCGEFVFCIEHVADIVIDALKRWGQQLALDPIADEPQFTNEEIAMHAAPWSLLLPPPAPAGSSITNGLEKVHEGIVSAPIPVSEQMPEPGIKVIAHYLNDLGKERTIMAEWVPAKSRKDDIDAIAQVLDLNDEDFAEYDEDDEKFYWPEGWYEVVENLSDYCELLVDNEVTHWQSLPASPYQDKKTNG